MSCTEIRDTLDAIHTMVRRIQTTLNTRLRASLPPPDGIETQNHGAGWWYLTWKPVPAARGYQQDHPDTGIGPTSGTRTSIFAVATGDTRVIRIRTVGADGSSAWVKCTVWWDGRHKTEIEGGGDPPPPEPVPVPTVDKVTAGHTSIAAWWTSTDVTQWEALLVDERGDQVPGQGFNVAEPRVIFNQLRPDTTYGFKVCAVAADGRRSDWSNTWWIKTRADGETIRPDPPTGLRIHCKADISAMAEWDQHADISAWEVWLDDNREAGAITTITPLVKLTKLQPDTEYTVHVVAVVGQPGEPGYAESDPASFTFRTKATVLPPDENPPGDIGADLPAPRDLVVRASSASEVEVSWRDDRPDGGERNFYVVCADGMNWQRVNGSHITLSDLPDRPETTVSVYGVIGKKLTGIARKATTMQEVGAPR